VRLLADGTLYSCGTLAELVGLPFSTCSYHLKQLLASGITEVEARGTQRFQVVRRDALESQFPGLIAMVAGQAETGPSPAPAG
jgi:hypothetical protein